MRLAASNHGPTLREQTPDRSPTETAVRALSPDNAAPDARALGETCGFVSLKSGGSSLKNRMQHFRRGLALERSAAVQ